MNTIQFAEKGLLPYWLIRYGIRKRLQKKLEFEKSNANLRQAALVDMLRETAIAENTREANEQHYEVPTDFFRTILGPHLKYSCGLWDEHTRSLEDAERASLELVAERAQLKNDQSILELGCGWGSFSLWAAKRFPHSSITAVSNSSTQGDYIRRQATRQGLQNLHVITADMNAFEPHEPFDRIVSIEMFEHMRNYEQLLERISHWLQDDGFLFVHIFTHRQFAYTFDAEEKDEWMARHFFTGGVMPSHDLLTHFDKHLKIEERWHLNGLHYSKTLEAWLDQLNKQEEQVRQLFNDCYGSEHATTWIWRWRLFILACSELFAYREGKEWGVSHYRFKKNM